MDKKLRKGDILLMQPAIILIVILFVFPLVYACKLIFTTPVYSENNQPSVQHRDARRTA